MGSVVITGAEQSWGVDGVMQVGGAASDPPSSPPSKDPPLPLEELPAPPVPPVLVDPVDALVLVDAPPLPSVEPGAWPPLFEQAAAIDTTTAPARNPEGSRMLMKLI
jgi:hypothetical protein